MVIQSPSAVARWIAYPSPTVCLEPAKVRLHSYTLFSILFRPFRSTSVFQVRTSVSALVTMTTRKDFLKVNPRIPRSPLTYLSFDSVLAHPRPFLTLGTTLDTSSTGRSLRLSGLPSLSYSLTLPFSQGLSHRGT